VALISGARMLDLTGGVLAAWSDATRGDLRPSGRGPADGVALAAFAHDLTGSTSRPVEDVTWATQVHGSQVLDVPDPLDVVPLASHGMPPLRHAGAGDALVSNRPGAGLSVLTADCGALALSSPEGVFAAVHVGWRGLLAGVVEATAERMRSMGATEIVGALGPCIHAGCYEFARTDLDAVAALYGDVVRGCTADGVPALDVPAGIAAALERAGARNGGGIDACTACGDGYFSHRARQDTARQALLVWSGPAGGMP
jgi:copper oxidase (laccase) domain-containing protein